MTVRIDPDFLVHWVREELLAVGEGALLDRLAARAAEDGLADDEAELEAAEEIADRRGLRFALLEAALGLDEVQVREARGGVEWIERALRPEGQRDLFGELSPSSCTAFVRSAPGAAGRLRTLARLLLDEPAASRAELPGVGGSPGCSLR
jgi:hypothetical protein